MATILSALRTNILHEHPLSEFERRDPVRPLYLADSLYDLVDDWDELHRADWSARSGNRSRYEHFLVTLDGFRCDERPAVGELNRVQPTSKGVWKMHSAGLRIYGWVPAPDRFVGITVALESDVHGGNSITDQKVSEVLEFAKRHGLENTINLGDRLALFPKKN